MPYEVRYWDDDGDEQVWSTYPTEKQAIEARYKATLTLGTVGWAHLSATPPDSCTFHNNGVYHPIDGISLYILYPDEYPLPTYDDEEDGNDGVLPGYA